MTVYYCSGCGADYCKDPLITIETEENRGWFCSNECALIFFEKRVKENPIALREGFTVSVDRLLDEKSSSELLICNICKKRFVSTECKLPTNRLFSERYYCPHCGRIIETQEI